MYETQRELKVVSHSVRLGYDGMEVSGSVTFNDPLNWKNRRTHINVWTGNDPLGKGPGLFIDVHEAEQVEALAETLRWIADHIDGGRD